METFEREITDEDFKVEGKEPIGHGFAVKQISTSEQLLAELLKNSATKETFFDDLFRHMQAEKGCFLFVKDGELNGSWFNSSPIDQMGILEAAKEKLKPIALMEIIRRHNES